MAKLMRDNESVTKKRNSVPIDPYSTNVASSPQLPSLEWTPEAKALCAREAGRAGSGESLVDVDKYHNGRIKCPAKDCCDNTFPNADALLVHLSKPIKQQTTTSPVSCMLYDFKSCPSKDKKVMLAHLEKHFEATYPCQFDGCPWLGRTQDDANRHNSLDGPNGPV